MGGGHHSPHCLLCPGLALSSPPDPPLLSAEEEGEHAHQGPLRGALRDRTNPEPWEVYPWLKCLCSGLTAGAKIRDDLASSDPPSPPQTLKRAVCSDQPTPSWSAPFTTTPSLRLWPCSQTPEGFLRKCGKSLPQGYLLTCLPASPRPTPHHHSPGCSSSGIGLRRCGRSVPGRFCPRLGLLLRSE